MDLASELIGRAHELKPVIAARALATEHKRSLPDETVKDLCDAGLMQMLTPKRFGGHELHIDTMAEVGSLGFHTFALGVVPSHEAVSRL